MAVVLTVRAVRRQAYAAVGSRVREEADLVDGAAERALAVGGAGLRVHHVARADGQRARAQPERAGDDGQRPPRGHAVEVLVELPGDAVPRIGELAPHSHRQRGAPTQPHALAVELEGHLHRVVHLVDEVQAARLRQQVAIGIARAARVDVRVRTDGELHGEAAHERAHAGHRAVGSVRFTVSGAAAWEDQRLALALWLPQRARRRLCHRVARGDLRRARERARVEAAGQVRRARQVIRSRPGDELVHGQVEQVVGVAQVPEVHLVVVRRVAAEECEHVVRLGDGQVVRLVARARREVLRGAALLLEVPHGARVEEVRDVERSVLMLPSMWYAVQPVSAPIRLIASRRAPSV